MAGGELTNLCEPELRRVNVAREYNRRENTAQGIRKVLQPEHIWKNAIHSTAGAGTLAPTGARVRLGYSKDLKNNLRSPAPSTAAILPTCRMANSILLWPDAHPAVAEELRSSRDAGGNPGHGATRTSRFRNIAGS